MARCRRERRLSRQEYCLRESIPLMRLLLPAAVHARGGTVHDRPIGGGQRQRVANIVMRASTCVPPAFINRCTTVVLALRFARWSGVAPRPSRNQVCSSFTSGQEAFLQLADDNVKRSRHASCFRVYASRAQAAALTYRPGLDSAK
jgi:hypothetical protein